MLAGVLLHVVEAPIPVDRRRRPTRRRRPSGAGEHVRDAIAFVDDVDDVDAAERAEIVRLAAGRRVERGLFEVDARAVVAATDDRGRERGEIRVGVIQSVRHGSRVRLIRSVIRPAADQTVTAANARAAHSGFPERARHRRRAR